VAFLFPRDLAEEILQDRGWQVTGDTSAAFEAAMEAQRERARAGATFDAADGTESGALYQRIGAEIPPIQFVG
jgi:alanyl-tRNA synthetase